MRILVVSDIHANWAALAAITRAVRRLPLSGRPGRLRARPAPCVRWAMAHATYAIRGNHDHGVAQGIPVSGANGFRYLTQVSRPSMWEALGPEERRYLLQLPVTQRVTLGGKRFCWSMPPRATHSTSTCSRIPQTWAKRLAERRSRRRMRGPYPHSVQHSGERRGGPQSRQRGLAARRRSRAAYAIIDDNKIEMKRMEYPVEQTDRPDRSDALAAAEQGHHGACFAPVDCPRILITTAIGADADEDAGPDED